MTRAILKRRDRYMNRVWRLFESSTTDGELLAHLPIWGTSLGSKGIIARQIRSAGKA